MQCPKCQFDNPEGMKFCVECGNKLETICSKCGFSNSPGFKFCGECGHNLTISSEPLPKDLSFDEKLDKIQKYLPKGLTEKILAQRDRIEGERKQVTVMFCDMEGFTRLSEKLGPEDAYVIMDKVYEILIHKVHDYGGTVNEMTGDGILAFFGAPIALEDAPQRAIRSSLAIHREMAKFDETLKNEKKTISPLRMRIGIHTGSVVVGTLGNDLHMEFKAVGDTVNLASRIESLAAPGTTYTSENTFKLTEGLFRFESQGQRTVKGKNQPVAVYRVVSPSMRRTRFDVNAESGLTPFIGRGRELELLMDSFDRAREGSGQTVLMVAEAGMGKSRLLYEFRKLILNEDATFFEGRCFSYSRTLPYHPVADILKSEFAITDDESSEAARKKVKAGLKAYEADENLTLPYLLEVLSVKDSGIDDIPLSPETKKDRIFEAVKLLVLKGSAIRPLVLAIEDLHWMDKSSEEMIKDLISSISGHRVLLILTYRPEGVANLSGKSYVNQINLLRLTNRQILNMIKSILATDAIDPSLVDLLLQRAEGVPFFIEEYLQSLKELKIITRDRGRYRLVKELDAVAVPSTIQDVIMARVDALPEEARGVLRNGAVIEREFSYGLIKQVTGLPERELLVNLSLLKDVELVYERGIFPDTTYVFKHALTREVLYNAILPEKQRTLHAKIGLAIEQIYEKNIEEHYGLLVDHFIAGGLYEKGAEYAKLAAKRAVRSISYKEAIDHSKSVIFCLERMPKTDAVSKKIIDVRAALAGYHLYLGQPSQAMEAVSPIVELAETMNYEKMLPAIYTAVGAYVLWVEEDYLKGLATMKKAMALSERLSNHVFFWIAGYFIGLTSAWQCQFDESLFSHNRCIALMESVKRPGLIATTKSWIGAHTYCFEGKLQKARESILEAVEAAQQSNELVTIGMADSGFGVVCFYQGLLDEAIPRLLEGVEICRKRSNYAWAAYASLYLGLIFFETREFENSRKYFLEMISMVRASIKIPSWIHMGLLLLTRTEVYMGQYDSTIDELTHKYENSRIKIFEGWMANTIGEILLYGNAEHRPEARKWIKRAIIADERNGMRWHLAKDYILYSNFLNKCGEHQKERQYLEMAVETFTACGADGWVEKYEKQLETFI
ncbi:MAG: adenylate/guanylate cyclase domain-containing protein [Thermodesulfobacteriota bacterium]|nr:adenylate/guanylate cyclase domain-containing protein [Thermodesulfobacteriota bacterium]